MSNNQNQIENKKLSRLSLNKETITDLELTRHEQDEVKGGATNTLVGDPQSIIGPKTISARCSYICK